MCSPMRTVEMLAGTELVDGVPLVKDQTRVLVCAHKGGREEEQDWGVALRVLNEEGDEEAEVHIGGDGHGRFNFSRGMVRRTTDYSRSYEGDISTVDGVKAFMDGLLCNIEKHLSAGTFNSDKGGYDSGGTTVWCLVKVPGILEFANCGDHKVAIRKRDGTIQRIHSWNWNNGVFNKDIGTWTSCDIESCTCSGCGIRTELEKYLGRSTKTFRHELGEGAQKNEERFIVNFDDLRLPETIGVEATPLGYLYSGTWKTVQNVLATFTRHTIIDPECDQWDIGFSSDGPYSHCALANIRQPEVPADIEDLMHLVYDKEELEFNKFAMCSQNSLIHKYIPQRYNMTVEELGALTSSKMLELFMDWFHEAYTCKHPKIDHSWWCALQESNDFVIKKDFKITADMTLEERIQMIQHFCVLCISDDNALICILKGVKPPPA